MTAEDAGAGAARHGVGQVVAAERRATTAQVELLLQARLQALQHLRQVWAGAHRGAKTRGRDGGQWAAPAAARPLRLAADSRGGMIAAAST